MPSRIALALTVLLLAVGAVRIGWLVAHDPVVGYGFEEDAQATSACLGLSPDLTGVALNQTRPEAPVARYVEGARRLDACRLTSEVALGAAALGAWKLAALVNLASARTMDARFVGMTHATLLFIVVLAITLALHERPLWRLVNAAVFAIVLADPLVTLWLNSLSSDFAAVLFAYAAVAALLVVACLTPDRGGAYFALTVALIGLGLARRQYAALPLLLTLLVLPLGWRHRRAAAAVLVAVSVVVLALQTVLVPAPPARAAQSIDLVLGRVLPASHEQPRALTTLGLPERCAAVIGATPRSTMGENLPTQCPEAATIAGSRVAGLLWAEPSILGRLWARAAPLMRVSLQHDLGILAGSSYATLADLRSPLAFSVVQLLDRLPLLAHIGLQLVLLTALVVALVAWVMGGARWGRSAGPLVTAALSGILVYAIATGVLGASLDDVSRRVHLGITAACAWIVVAVVGLVCAGWAHRTPRIVAGTPVGPPTPFGYTFTAFLAALVVAMSVVVWGPAFRRQSLAVGGVEEPMTNRLASRRVVLQGWALDPFAAPRVYALVDGTTRIDARPLRLPADPDGIALAREFPGYVDPAKAGFEIAFDTLVAGKPLHVRTYAANGDGLATEIDRRVLVPVGGR